VHPPSSQRSHTGALTRRFVSVLSLLCAIACSVAPSAEVISSLETSVDPACPAGMACGGGAGQECSGIELTCSQGELTGVVGTACEPFVGRCELGCRKDYAPSAVVHAEGTSEEQARELGHTLCEEYRLLQGARRPGDPCNTEFDCLPYAAGSPRDGMSWPDLMTCVDNECRERAPSVPGDLGAACTPDASPEAASGYSAQGIVVPGSCENSLCNIANDVPGTPGHCTLQCKDDAGCPRGWVCWNLSIGPIVDPYSFGSGNFCVDPCSWLDCGGTSDAGVPDAGAAG
jgi:hypothetical protein